MRAFVNIFKHSIQLPKRQAAFALNRIGMDVVILYLFTLLGIASIPGLVDQFVLKTNETTVEVQMFFGLIFFFIFYYLMMTMVVFVCISFIAYIGSLIARATNRKLKYGILWKMAACIGTIPVSIFTIISFWVTPGMLFLAIISLFHFFVFIQTILLYPKRRHTHTKK